MNRIVTDQRDRVAAWVAQRIGRDCAWEGAYAMGVEDESGQLIGGVAVVDFNGVNASLHVAGEGRRWCSRKFLRTVCDYLFLQCGLRRVTGIVPSSNAAALQFDLRAGFEIEAVLRDADPGGDLIVLVMWRDKCPWLKGA